MFQTIAGIDVFVVDLPELPELPITWSDTPSLQLYADALDTAIRTGVVTEPGKYAINVTDSGKNYTIFRVNE